MADIPVNSNSKAETCDQLTPATGHSEMEAATADSKVVAVVNHSQMGATAQDSKDSRTPAKVTFLNLPAEVRLIIYENVLANYQLDLKTYYWTGKIKRPSWLLNTCTTMRTEAVKTYFERLFQILSDKKEELAVAKAGIKELTAWEKMTMFALVQEQMLKGAAYSTLALEFSTYLRALREEQQYWTAKGYTVTWPALS